MTHRVYLTAFLLMTCACGGKGLSMNSSSDSSNPDPVSGSEATSPKDEPKNDAPFRGTYSQKPDLPTAMDVDLWKKSVKSLEGQASAVAKTCEADFAIDIDYASFAPAMGDDLPRISHVVGHCEAVLGGFMSNCADAERKASVSGNLKSVLCQYDPATKTEIAFSWNDGVYRAGYSRISTNIYNDSYNWLAKSLPPAP